MPDQTPGPFTATQLRDRALARWENEGGADAGGRDGSAVDHLANDVPALTNAELSQLHIRVIALEGLVAALLADASDTQLARARDMAAYICPRPGVTEHPLTLRAATQMVDLIERAGRFRATPP